MTIEITSCWHFSALHRTVKSYVDEEITTDGATTQQWKNWPQKNETSSTSRNRRRLAPQLDRESEAISIFGCFVSRIRNKGKITLLHLHLLPRSVSMFTNKTPAELAFIASSRTAGFIFVCFSKCQSDQTSLKRRSNSAIYFNWNRIVLATETKYPSACELIIPMMPFANTHTYMHSSKASGKGSSSQM